MVVGGLTRGQARRPSSRCGGALASRVTLPATPTRVGVLTAAFCVERADVLWPDYPEADDLS
jgi:hypothetical protein